MDFKPESVSLVFNTMHLVEEIFEYLPARDLLSCACVCQFWNSIANVELKKHKKIIHFFQGVEQSAERSKRQSSKRITTFENEFHDTLKNLKIKPVFCIAFGNESFWEQFEELFPSHVTPKKRFKKEFDYDARQKHFDSVVKTIFKKYLPKSCEISFYIGHGIIASFSDPDGSKEVRYIETPAITGYFFPEVPCKAVELCTQKEQGREIIKVLASRMKIGTVLVIAEHRILTYLSIALNETKHHFDVFKHGVVFSCQVGSNNIPVFSGWDVHAETLDFNFKFQKVPISNNDTIGFAFLSSTLYEIREKRIFENSQHIPVIGLFGYSKMESDSDRAIFCTGRLHFCDKAIFVQINSLKVNSTCYK